MSVRLYEHKDLVISYTLPCSFCLDTVEIYIVQPLIALIGLIRYT